ncbi:MAG: Gfo/Idh/MocA family oxidoreductase [Candidatus Lokiarchaeia archaeon]
MLRVGIIGCGDIANLNVLGYIHSQDSEIVAVSDTDIKKAGNKLEQWGLRTLKIYPDYREMIDHEDLDIVEILTPHHLHGPMTEYCAKAGIAGISVQKPMAHTITDCEKMIRVCEEEKVKLKIYENFRFYPIYLKAKELLDNGIIGELLNFRINSIMAGGPSMLRDLKSTGWRQNFDICGGGPWVYDDGIHKFSMALWLMDQEQVEKVYGWIDYFAAVFDGPSYIFWKYPSGKVDEPPKFGIMEITLASNLYYPSNYYMCDEYIEISGTKGLMWINQCTCGGNFISKSPQFPPIIIYTNGEANAYGNDLPRDWRYSFINSTEHFIDIMKRGGAPIYNGEQGKSLSIFAKMAHLSDQQKRAVNWEEITSENEKNRSCLVETPKDINGAGLHKYFMRIRKDLKKGINQGLIHKELKYDKDLLLE